MWLNYIDLLTPSGSKGKILSKNQSLRHFGLFQDLFGTIRTKDGKLMTANERYEEDPMKEAKRIEK